MTPVFDAYVIVDWSASAVPKTGADSVWYCCLERRDGGFAPERVANPRTRRAAIDHLAMLLADLVARDRVTLVGFDFAFGYPKGFAARVSPDEPTWRGVWTEIAARVHDDEDNTNNRFEVAAGLNERVSGRAFPFWGCPKAAAGPLLTATKPDGYQNGLAERRLADAVVAGPQPVWKLAYTGSVGSQTLLGIAHADVLRRYRRIAEVTRIWPFETGLAPLSRPGARDWRVLMAETWPSIVPPDPAAGDTRDERQVRTLARHFASLDDREALAPLFAGPPELNDDERATVEREEAWILGIETARKSATKNGYDYVRKPAEIYRRSFATVRAEADLSAVPEDLRDLAVRLIHACGMPDLVADLAWTEDAAAAGKGALAVGAPILVDAEMVGAGIIRGRLPAANPVICTLGDPDVAARAEAAGTTRSAAAVELWRPHLAGSVVAIGNAPTALFRLLEHLVEGAPRPALVLGFPVGFVGAAESKEALIDHPAGVPYVTLRGRRGGSAIAAAAVNALAGAAP